LETGRNRNRYFVDGKQSKNKTAGIARNRGWLLKLKVEADSWQKDALGDFHHPRKGLRRAEAFYATKASLDHFRVGSSLGCSEERHF
jgi:hypothetical protein